MNLSFDYYRNFEDYELYLCNPAEGQMYVLQARDRKLQLRFNDISELTFTVTSVVEDARGKLIKLPSYDYVETRRRIYIPRIGWFVITNVQEEDTGTSKSKSVTCESYQAIFKDRGVLTEEKVYYLYNPDDPYDRGYEFGNEGSVPSVVGQLYQQLGIQQDLAQGLDEPSMQYNDWTITYVPNTFIGNVGRNFKEETNTGYDFMVKKVEDAFEVVFVFDFLYKSIQIKLPEEVTTTSNTLFTFSNFMKDVKVEEDASELVTVLDCDGDGINITLVNPMGTNYICDFSYYMDSANQRWMSPELIAKLQAWQSALSNARPTYRSIVGTLQEKYQAIAELNSELQTISTITTDMETAYGKRAMAQSEGSSVSGIVKVESVEVNHSSLDTDSVYYQSVFLSTSTLTTYRDQPTYNGTTHTWTFSGPSYTGTADACYGYVDSDNKQYHYFQDTAAHHSYCKLEGAAKLNVETVTTEYVCKGFDRYSELNDIDPWIAIYVEQRQEINEIIASNQQTADSYVEQLNAISNQVNIITYFSDTPGLFKELTAYWIEGSYTNDNISLLDDMTMSEQIELANELYDAGTVELSKNSQPRFKFSLDMINVLSNYEFRTQMRDLALGKIITIEKEEGVWYYPALIELDIDLDDPHNITLSFANRLRLDDWGYTYTDLISKSASTTKQVNSNWSDLTSYSKNKETINSLIRAPLNATLRASFANMVNQEFQVDNNGILGRRFTDASQSAYSDEQLRIINNLIIFTDDGWETAKTALGKIYYTDPDTQQQTTAYGLIAETIIGDLVMSERLKVINSNSTVVLDENGILIKDSSNQTVFQATPSGSTILKGYATTSGLDATYARIENGETQTFKYTLNAYGMTLYANGSVVMSVASNSSMLAGWYFDSSMLYVRTGSTYAGLYSGTTLTGPSLVTSGATSPVRFFAGSPSVSALSSGTFVVLQDGSLYCTAGSFSLAGSYSDPISGSTTGLCQIANGRIQVSAGLNSSAWTFLSKNGLFITGDSTSSILYFCSQGTTQYSLGGPPSSPGTARILFTLSTLNPSGQFKGTWTSDSAITVTSDRSLKHHIEPLDDKYSKLFYSLIPRRFKYNNGTSNRYHTGFIAQEVLDAMSTSGLTSQELAAYVKFSGSGGITPTDEEHYGLRYEEFVALNTREIQKLEARVAQLEQELEALRGQ